MSGRPDEGPLRSRGRSAWAVVGSVLLALIVGLVWLVADRPAPAEPEQRDPETGLAYVALASLPVQARQTVALIDAGGPFPYAKDGAVFGNREELLPARAQGFYREYTVPTPGEGDRGARRIVTGDGDRQLFYTADHYASFVRVRR